MSDELLKQARVRHEALHVEREALTAKLSRAVEALKEAEDHIERCTTWMERHRVSSDWEWEWQEQADDPYTPARAFLAKIKENNRE